MERRYDDYIAQAGDTLAAAKAFWALDERECRLDYESALAFPHVPGAEEQPYAGNVVGLPPPTDDDVEALRRIMRAPVLTHDEIEANLEQLKGVNITQLLDRVQEIIDTGASAPPVPSADRPARVPTDTQLDEIERTIDAFESHGLLPEPYLSPRLEAALRDGATGDQMDRMLDYFAFMHPPVAQGPFARRKLD